MNTRPKAYKGYMSNIITTITEAATQPASAVPVTGLVAVGNLFSLLPEIVNVLTIVYVSLLIIHKAWKMYAEWKEGSITKDKDI